MLPGSPLATRAARSASRQEDNDESSLPIARRLFAMVKAFPPFVREIVTVSSVPRTKVAHNGRSGHEHRRRTSEDSLEMSETCVDNPMVAFTCSTSTVQSTNVGRDGASSMGHRSRISEDSLETSDIFLDNTMAASTYSVVLTQSSPVDPHGATLTASVDNSGRTRMTGSDSRVSTATSSNAAVQSWNVSSRVDNRNGGDKLIHGDYDEPSSIGSDLPVATVWHRPSRHPKGTDLHVSRSDSFARVTESGQRSLTTSSWHGVDRTSTDRLRGLYITSSREITSKGYECGSMFSSEQSVGLDTRSGDIVELANARTSCSPRGSPISQRSDSTTTQARIGISNSGISSAATADQPKPNQAGLSLNCDRTFLEKPRLAGRSLAERTAAATSPPGLDRLNNSTETGCEGGPSGAPYVDINIGD